MKQRHLPLCGDGKQPVFFQRGNVGVAVRASSAVAGVISAVGELESQLRTQFE